MWTSALKRIIGYRYKKFKVSEAININKSYTYNDQLMSACRLGPGHKGQFYHENLEFSSSRIK